MLIKKVSQRKLRMGNPWRNTKQLPGERRPVKKWPPNGPNYFLSLQGFLM
jgi:hypothetical protein